MDMTIKPQPMLEIEEMAKDHKFKEILDIYRKIHETTDKELWHNGTILFMLEILTNKYEEEYDEKGNPREVRQRS